MLRGRLLVLVLLVAVGLFMAAVAIVGIGLRQDYRIASKGEGERTGLDLTDERVAWLEVPGKVWAYDIAGRRSELLEASDASSDRPIALTVTHAAWVEGPAPFRVALHDFRNGTTWRLGAPGGNLTLPGRTLAAEGVLVAGSVGNASGLWWYDLGNLTLQRAAVQAPADAPMRLAWPRAFWLAQGRLHVADARTGVEQAPVEDAAPVAGFDADGDLVAWHDDPRPAAPRRVSFLDLGSGARGEVSAFPGQQWDPAVAGIKVAFLQNDGLVRLKDLATGQERVLPARDQENVRVRLAPHWAAWLSGTIEGHNVLLTPAGFGP
jgi:hypothetical protein